MINIYLNNQLCTLASIQSLHDFLLANNQTDEHFAVALNNEFVPRNAYQTITLKPNDRIDIIVPMQGG
ncbi:sulfur carrier protein ThiS [Legionella sp. D16C41]|uniref:sulfur carrier protein ThiS n=1 Tax=Legionella sp. D16C41 TaxID=3402688 RepID=UPI003AF754BD